mmetsp:Transcript_42206/g.59077  ORF Transcript_42206/g.59077 Transcript_42206/m.59077 type:complete len:89 (-) Transcript_42206:118-384(-)
MSVVSIFPVVLLSPPAAIFSILLSLPAPLSRRVLSTRFPFSPSSFTLSFPLSLSLSFSFFFSLVAVLPLVERDNLETLRVRNESISVQ